MDALPECSLILRNVVDVTVTDNDSDIIIDILQDAHTEYAELFRVTLQKDDYGWSERHTK